MATVDLYNNLSVATTLAPAARTANANGSAVDLQGYEGALIQAIVGTITDGTHSLTVEESADGATWTAVAAADLQGSFANLVSNTNQKVGYLGTKRYIRVNAAVTGATSGGVYAVVVLRGNSRKHPV
ncbi:hypothetical protein [Marinobacter sp.]|uniref:hypothetical protein n=1 Tax=Marinobacter sp. TaxID=50741 RepID=UPI001984C8F2|nr:hypothetical protein [Marinobacter sp.]MBC7193872.1 hypothetical protein [Marinobacter sp.]